MGQHRIVVVDDHPLFLRGVVSVLEADGLSVAGTATGLHEALQVVAATRPDAVLLDLHMEDGSGHELLRRLREVHGDALTLVVLTVSSDPAQMLEAVRNGADGYLTKDQPPEQLPRALRGALAGEAALSRAMAAHVVRAARHADVVQARPRLRARLTPRQLEILQLIASGATTREIADRLVLSPETVRWHVKAILRKLGARTRAEAASALREVVA
jgi:two-component system, NarL family, nitrate/nitrite response regulator NarL